MQVHNYIIDWAVKPGFHGVIIRQPQKLYVYRCRIRDKRTQVHIKQQQHTILKPICNLANAKWPLYAICPVRDRRVREA